MKTNSYKTTISNSILPGFAKLSVLLIAIALIGLASFSNWFSRPRVWAVSEVPITFWAWQRTSPNQQDVNAVLKEVQSKILFLHAGQIDYVVKTKDFNLIRQPEGVLPKAINIHLVYNATVDLLNNLENIDLNHFAKVISEYYKADLYKANENNSQVVGIQLDIDVPTRLLPKYTELLQALRANLPTNTSLSITGLPTWMNSPALKDTLAKVDFWVPQFYGAVIPKNINKLTPISSPQMVAQGVEKARLLGQPFYAGLSAYGYAIRYDSSGRYMQIRGDIDFAKALNNIDLELVERKTFDSSKQTEKLTRGEWVYVYRVSRDLVIDGMILQKNDWLMLDLPTASNLQENAKVVREVAGENLLGICIFRLPTSQDTTNLTLSEVTRAVKNIDPKFQAELYLDLQESTLFLTLKNTSNSTLILEPYAVTLDVKIPIEKLLSITLDGFSSKDYFCDPSNNATITSYFPCNSKRANILRLNSKYLRPGQELRAVIELTDQLPANIAARISISNDGAIAWQKNKLFPIRKR